MTTPKPASAPPVKCSCRRSDAWKCAVDQRLTTHITCQCECHRAASAQVREPKRPATPGKSHRNAWNASLDARAQVREAEPKCSMCGGSGISGGFVDYDCPKCNADGARWRKAKPAAEPVPVGLCGYIEYLRGDKATKYADPTNSAVQGERLRIADELEQLAAKEDRKWHTNIK